MSSNNQPNGPTDEVGELFLSHRDHDHPFIRGEVKRLIARSTQQAVAKVMGG